MATRRTARSRRAWVGLVLASQLAVACGGPLEPLDVGIKELRSDIVLGSAAREEPPPPVFVPPDAIPVALPPTVPVSLPPVPPPFTPPNPTPQPKPVDPCPPADPLSAPQAEAFTRITDPPREGTYTFRNRGFFETSGANAQRGDLPDESVRTVENVVVDDAGNFTYDVRSLTGGHETVTSYLVRLDAPVAPPPTPYTTAPEVNGLYITAMSSLSATGDTQTFDPTPDLLLLPLPADSGQSWRASGTDALAGITMRYTGTVLVKARVDACGQYLDSITVQIAGALVDCVDVGSPNPALPDPADPVCPPGGEAQQVGGDAVTAFEARYQIGTQFGGLLLEESVIVNDTGISGNAHRENVSTINVVPALPERAT